MCMCCVITDGSLCVHLSKRSLIIHSLLHQTICSFVLFFSSFFFKILEDWRRRGHPGGVCHQQLLCDCVCLGTQQCPPLRPLSHILHRIPGLRRLPGGYPTFTTIILLHRHVFTVLANRKFNIITIFWTLMSLPVVFRAFSLEASWASIICNLYVSLSLPLTFSISLSVVAVSDCSGCYMSGFRQQGKEPTSGPHRGTA